MSSQAHTLVENEISHVLTQTEDSHVLQTVERGTTLEVTELILPDQGYVTSNVVDTIVTLTQAEYDLLTPVPTTLYVIIG